ncbi:MAG TPA: class I tRNA ligase family protein, partial [Candidatus Paceibacterota bacterium]
LETGYEILFFWVARMILMSQYALGEIPFKTVYLHGTVRDQQGRKMSKSLGNGIDPIDVAKEFGADAGRMALVVGNTPGMDTKIWKDKIKAYKLFANKLWNIARFVLESAGDADMTAPLTTQDQEYWAQFQAIAADVTKDIDEYRIYMAAEKLYQYLWSVFAANILEESKPIIKTGTPEEAASRKRFLIEVLQDSLKLLHPFMPFVTEEIWAAMPSKKSYIMVESWPVQRSL